MNWGAIIAAAAPYVGKALSGASKGSEQSRRQDDQSAMYRDRNAADAIAEYERAQQARAKLEMEQRAFDAKSREAGFMGAMRGDAIRNWQPANRPGGVANISFVQRPGAGGQAAAAEYERQAMLRLMNGEKFDELPALERFAPTAPKQASTWEKLAGMLGLGLQAYGGYKGYRNNGPMGGDQE